MPSLKESSIYCSRKDKLVIVDRSVRIPFCLFIIIFVHKRLSFLCINLENSIVIIENIKIGRQLKIELILLFL